MGNIIMSLSEKQKRYLADGMRGVLHKNRGNPSRRAWSKNERDFSIKLFSKDFKDFGPTYGAEKLEELHNIKISKETLRKELGVEVIHARRPQAKDLVERVNRTLKVTLTCKVYFYTT